ncbi:MULTISPECIES: hypothetical protein [Leptospira]|uniref:DNA methyltransferase n=1 Tax=Leptospira bandrabouensis TaxID=2484903 RepID=A0A6H3NIU6_9LEPT|nr:MULTISPECIES: hypothetical protein [Leptospira]MCG6150309.1 hypothetical protein [Leptospira levettii]MCG6154060.1 hypothetical protein [Leptospira bandrabouensis]TGN10304.1 hypothetical protein EHR08_19530 [Leptospira bandrabouensis]
MDYSAKLIELIEKAKLLQESDYATFSSEFDNYLFKLADSSFRQKAVFTVIVTLGIYKILHPNQDIRYHQSQLPGGFSGRSIDTRYITPILRIHGFPSMAESGWLTRSLEQAAPYDSNYPGKIGDRELKIAFLKIIEKINTEIGNVEIILINILAKVHKLTIGNESRIIRLESPEKIKIDDLICLLEAQFKFNYGTHGGSKIPVIAFHTIYELLIEEIERFSGCELKPLGSHTASDRSSRSSGDIEIFKDEKLFEAIEIKLDIPISANLIRIVKEKILKFNPVRYYVLSNSNIEESELTEIDHLIKEIYETHGCQVIINGLIPTLKYYFRLLDDTVSFFDKYQEKLLGDSELLATHKEIFQRLVYDCLKQNSIY